MYTEETWWEVSIGMYCAYAAHTILQLQYFQLPPCFSTSWLIDSLLQASIDLFFPFMFIRDVIICSSWRDISNWAGSSRRLKENNVITLSSQYYCYRAVPVYVTSYKSYFTCKRIPTSFSCTGNSCSLRCCCSLRRLPWKVPAPGLKTRHSYWSPNSSMTNRKDIILFKLTASSSIH